MKQPIFHFWIANHLDLVLFEIQKNIWLLFENNEKWADSLFYIRKTKNKNLSFFVIKIQIENWTKFWLLPYCMVVSYSKTYSNGIGPTTHQFLQNSFCAECLPIWEKNCIILTTSSYFENWFLCLVCGLYLLDGRYKT